MQSNGCSDNIYNHLEPNFDISVFSSGSFIGLSLLH